jgi:hypothetical protein
MTPIQRNAKRIFDAFFVPVYQEQGNGIWSRDFSPDDAEQLGLSRKELDEALAVLGAMGLIKLHADWYFSLTALGARVCQDGNDVASYLS